jgi:hypothetical protein
MDRDEIGGVYLPAQLEHRYIATLYVLVTIAKGGGRAPRTLTSQGWFFHHDGMYARKRPLPLSVYSVEKKFFLQLRSLGVHS